jgi:hypothetical protein
VETSIIYFGSTGFNGITLFKHKGHKGHEGKTRKINALSILCVLGVLRVEAFSHQKRKSLYFKSLGDSLCLARSGCIGAAGDPSR